MSLKSIFEMIADGKKQMEKVEDLPHKIYFTQTLADDFGYKEGDIISEDGYPKIEVAILEQYSLD